jgi:hypothetical protein
LQCPLSELDELTPRFSSYRVIINQKLKRSYLGAILVTSSVRRIAKRLETPALVMASTVPELPHA